MTNSKEKMLKAVNRMEKIVDQYFGQQLQQELAQLREALENGDDADISDAISQTIDGCGTATSELRDLNWAMDQFEQAQHDFDKVIDDAISEFENK